MVWLLLALAGCQPLPAPAQPTLEPLRVQLTPALRPWQRQLSSCASNVGGIGLFIAETTAPALNAEQADMVLQLGGGKTVPGYTAQIGMEELVIVASQGLGSSKISLDDLAALYQGASKDSVRVWTYYPGDDLRLAFETITGITTADPGISQAPGPAAVLEISEGDEQAVGYLTSSWVEGEDVLTFTGFEAERLQIPVLAITHAEPQGLARKMIACLQE